MAKRSSDAVIFVPEPKWELHSAQRAPLARRRLLDRLPQAWRPTSKSVPGQGGGFDPRPAASRREGAGRGRRPYLRGFEPRHNRARWGSTPTDAATTVGPVATNDRARERPRQETNGDPLLLTKLSVPAARTSLVRRLRLSRRFEEGLGGKLTLLSAPLPALARPHC